jgi:hypothetical protein
MDVEAISAAAVGLVAPYLAKFGESAASKVGEASVGATGKVLGWMRKRLTGRAREALTDLEKAPNATDNQADARKQLARLLEQEPTLLEELRELLPTADSSAQEMNQLVGGVGAQAVQIRGDGNTTSQS